jgi:hypothetical protein
MLSANFVFGVRMLVLRAIIQFLLSREFLASPPPLDKKHRHPFITTFDDIWSSARAFAAFSTDFIFSRITYVPRRRSKPAKSSMILRSVRVRLESTFSAFAHPAVESRGLATWASDRYQFSVFSVQFSV